MTHLVCPFCRIALAPSEATCPRDGHPGREVAWQRVPGGLFKRFQVVEPFGHGQMGSTYLADEPETGRRGLLQVLVPPRPGREAERARLKRELLKQATLAAPGVVTPLASGESEGVAWVFRPQVAGTSLAVTLHGQQTLPEHEALSVTAQLAVALDGLHRGGILHRNLTPTKVLLHPGDDGRLRARLIGTGMAPPLRWNGSQAASGTAGYIAPEQISGKLVSFRSDLYSLGCLVYEMLSGRPAFAGEDREGTLQRQLAGHLPPLPPGLPSAIQELICTLLSKDPQERPFSAKKVRRTLDPYLPESASMTRRSPTSPQPASGPGNGSKPPRSLPPPPPPEAALRKSSPAPAGTPRPSSGSARPPPPPPRAGADSTQQLDIRQIEEIRISSHGEPGQRPAPPPAPNTADQTQELSIEQLVAVSRAAPPASEPPPERSDYTVPIRLDQIVGVSSSRRSSAAPPRLPEPPPPAAPPPEAPEEGDLFEGADAEGAAQDATLADLPVHFAEADEPAGDETAKVSPASDAAARPRGIGPGPEATAASVSPASDATVVPSDATVVELPPPAAVLHALSARPAVTADAAASKPAPRAEVATSPAPEPNVPVQREEAAPAAAEKEPEARPKSSPASRDAMAAAQQPRPPLDSALPAGSQEDSTLSIPGLKSFGSALTKRGSRRSLALAAGLVLLGAVAASALLGGESDEAAAPEAERPDDAMHVAAAAPEPAAEKPSAAAPSMPLAAAPQDDSQEPGAAGEEALAAEGANEAAPPDELPADEPAAQQAEAEPEAETDEANALDTEAAAPAETRNAEGTPSKRAAARRERRQEQRRAARERRAEPKAGTQSEWARAREEARQHYAAKRYRQAAHAYERAIRHNPNDAGTFAGLGAARLLAGNTAGSIAAYRRAVSLAPRSAGFHAALGRAYLGAGDRRNARASYKRALALDPNNAAAKKGLTVVGD